MLATQRKPETLPNQRIAFKNILLATDFSAAAYAALPFAANLAKSFGANFFVLHVQEPTNYAVPPEMWQSIRQAHQEEERVLRFEMKSEHPTLQPKFLEAEGDVAFHVAEAVEKNEIDLLVLGTRGRTGLGKAMLGSKAEEILRRVHCAVLTVGPYAKCRVNGHVNGHAVPEGEARMKLNCILYATHFGEASMKAARVAVSLAEENQSRLTLMTVLQPRDHKLAEAGEEYGEAGERELRKLLPDEANLWCVPHFVVEHGNAAEKILEVARGANADLVVLGAHRPEGVAGAATHLPTATIHQVITHAECPVLTIRA
jgi:nucleotide-binding universal stress UspA family protein